MEKLNIRYGVVGTGHMGTYHINVLSKIPNIDFIGVHDCDEQKLASVQAKYNIKAYSSLDELLDRCNVVSLAVPTTIHYALAKKIIEKGKHILIEKPICERIEEAEELIELAKTKNIILHVGHVERFNGAVQELSNIVHRPLLWESRRLGPNLGRVKDVGVILDLMIHDIDICLRTVRSKVNYINAQATYLPGSDHEDVASCQLGFENGCIAVLNASRITQEKVRTLFISQEDCYISLDFTTQDLQLHRQAISGISTSKEKIRYKQESLIERLFIHKENPLQSEIEHFIGCIDLNVSSYETNKLDLETLRITQTIMEIVTKKNNRKNSLAVAIPNS